MLDSYLTYLHNNDYSLIEQDVKTIKHQKLAQHYEATAQIKRIQDEAKQAYHTEMSAADRTCRGVEDKEKNNCMNRYKQRALRNLRFNISKALAYCRDTKDQLVCRRKIFKKLDKIDAKLE